MNNWWGDLIRDLRAEQRISQRQLSRLAQVNRSTLRRIEQGTARGEIAVLERLLSMLGYELEVLAKAGLAERRCRDRVGLTDSRGFRRVTLLLVADRTEHTLTA
jgi:transcriptional regulator with XRE-family HTH domain